MNISNVIWWVYYYNRLYLYPFNFATFHFAKYPRRGEIKDFSASFIFCFIPDYKLFCCSIIYNTLNNHGVDERK